jgi:hypothetical protein
MSEQTTTIDNLETRNALLQRKLKSLRSKIRLYQQVGHVCGPRCGRPACIRERKIERLRQVLAQLLDAHGKGFGEDEIAMIYAVMKQTEDFTPHYSPPIELPPLACGDKDVSTEAEDEHSQVDNADLRVRSAGAAGAYAFQPLTPAGWRFTKSFAASVEGGCWSDGAFWFPSNISPYEVLGGSPLTIVSGIGSNAENDRPWPSGYRP